MFKRCYRCYKPQKACLCDYIRPIDTGIKFVLLMHPKEAYQQKTGTGRLASQSLIDSEILIGIDFTDNARLNALLDSSGDGAAYQPFLLFPGEKAWHTEDPGFPDLLRGKKPLVIIVDATWFFAKKILRLSSNLHDLPTLSFRNSYRSQFEFKTQPAPECLSTIESAYYLIEEFKSNNLISAEVDPSGLMKVFHEMVRYQLSCEQIRHEAMAAELYPELFQN